MSIVFGPIPSRRLGRSLGINNIPPKVCSYSCVYCQVGFTDTMSIKRREYFSPDEIYKELSGKIIQIKKAGEKIDYLSFVPEGEPTLDINIGNTIEKLSQLGIKIAVITNASLLRDEEVRSDLMKADWVSVKVDTVDEDIWRKINRPHGSLELKAVLTGIEKFADSYKGVLVTETMLVKGINDGIECLAKTATTISRFRTDKSYLLVPIRPPAEKFIEPATEENLNMAYQIFNGKLNNVEMLINSEGNNFTYLSDTKRELLNILAVHPMRKKAVEEYLLKSNTNWNLIDNLIDADELKIVKYNNATYLVKNIKRCAYGN